MKVELSIKFTVALLIVKHLKLDPQEGYEAALALLDELKCSRLKNSQKHLANRAGEMVMAMWPMMLPGSKLGADLQEYFDSVIIAYWTGALNEEDNRYIGSII